MPHFPFTQLTYIFFHSLCESSLWAGYYTRLRIIIAREACFSVNYFTAENQFLPNDTQITRQFFRRKKNCYYMLQKKKKSDKTASRFPCFVLTAEAVDARWRKPRPRLRALCWLLLAWASRRLPGETVPRLVVDGNKEVPCVCDAF